MPIFNVGAAGTTSSAFEVTNSLRFDDASSDYLVRTNSSTSNRRTYTVSFWLKKADTLTEQNPVFAGDLSGANPYFDFRFDSSQIINWYHSDSGGSKEFNLKTNAVFRDSSAWYHFVLALDTTQATDSNRVKLYVNGVQITSFSEATYPAQNFDTAFNVNNYEVQFGKIRNNSPTLNGYIAEAVLVDGQQLTPSSFGEFDDDTGIWKPKAVSGLTFGTNGFYLDFKNSGSLGADVSGNGNNFTSYGFTSVDQSTDTPNNNFATWNPLWSQTNGNVGDVAFTEGNLKATSSVNYRTFPATIGFSSGKWFWEVKRDGTSADVHIGVMSENATPANTATWIGNQANGWMYTGDGGQTYTGGTSQNNYSAFTTNDIVQVAFDADNGKVYFGKNGTFQGSSNPASGTYPAYSGLDTSLFYFPAASLGPTVLANFGSPPYSESGGNSDANGHGNFSSSVPSGYYAICTKNLAEFG